MRTRKTRQWMHTRITSLYPYGVDANTLADRMHCSRANLSAYTDPPMDMYGHPIFPTSLIHARIHARTQDSQLSWCKPYVHGCLADLKFTRENAYVISNPHSRIPD